MIERVRRCGPEPVRDGRGVQTAAPCTNWGRMVGPVGRWLLVWLAVAGFAVVMGCASTDSRELSETAAREAARENRLRAIDNDPDVVRNRDRAAQAL